MGSIAKESVKATIGVKNLVYNIKRYGFWENKNPKAVGELRLNWLNFTFF